MFLYRFFFRYFSVVVIFHLVFFNFNFTQLLLGIFFNVSLFCCSISGCFFLRFLVVAAAYFNEILWRLLYFFSSCHIVFCCCCCCCYCFDVVVTLYFAHFSVLRFKQISFWFFVAQRKKGTDDFFAVVFYWRIKNP